MKLMILNVLSHNHQMTHNVSALLILMEEHTPHLIPLFAGNAWHDETVPQNQHLRIASNEDTSFPTYVLSHRGNDLHNLVKCNKSSEITRLTGIRRGRSVRQYDDVIYWLESGDYLLF